MITGQIKNSSHSFPKFISSSKLIILLSSLFCFSFHTKIYAQKTDIIFEQLFLQHGLSQSIVKCIWQDKRGYMYFGTEDGLNRYDGYKFTIFRHKPDDTNSLSYNDITSIYEDHNGIFWIGTFNAGLNRYDPSNESFIRFRHNPNDTNSLSHENINAIIEDKSGQIWIGTDNGLNKLIVNDSAKNIYSFHHYINNPKDKSSISSNIILSIYQDKAGTIWVGTGDGLNKIIFNNQKELPLKFIRYQHNSEDPHSLSNDTARVIFEDSKGNLWIGTDNGLNKLKIKDNSFIIYKHDYKNKNSLSHNQIYALCEDNSGVLWIGTNGGGLNLFDKKNNSFERYLYDPQNSRSLSYNEIRSIYKDVSGIMWIGTYGGGIDKVSRGVNQFYLYSHISDNTNSLSHPIVWSIYEDEDSILWIGTHGGGMDRLDRRKNKYTHFVNDPKNPNSLSSNIVRNIIEDRNGLLWIGTHGGGINIFNRKTKKFKSYRHNPQNASSLAYDEIRTIYQDRSGVIWIGTYGRGLDKFEQGNDTFIHYRNVPGNTSSLSNDFVRIIYEDKAGNFWIGTEGGGLNKFIKDKNIFINYSSNPNDSNSISNDYIFSIYEDKAGILWLGTFGGGLNKFNPQTGVFKNYTTKNGLPSDAIYGILADEKENLWLSTNNGLSKFNPSTETFKNYNERDGLQSNEFNGGSYFKSKSGEMFFGGIEGFNTFYPGDIKDNSYIPPIVITSFQKFNKEFHFEKPISFIKKINLSYHDYVFSFEFAALDYTAPEKNKYAYKMEGLDKDWFYTSSEKRYANYTTLPPGKYVFRVRGSNSDGIWNDEGTSLIIIISPPFWQTWWFTLIIALVFAAIILTLYKRRLRNVRLKAELSAAHNAQMSIMPHSDPQIDGLDISSICIPANEVGGDFFDYFWTQQDSTKLGIMIGDVSGKAMTAAMTAVMTSGMLNTEANNAESLGTILSRVNVPLYNKTTKQMFTAVCLACIDPKNKELVFTNAGLSNPILKSNGKIEYLKSVGPRFPLGMMKEVKYDEKKIKLSRGSLLIFLTDGIIEARDHLKELYGEERLEKLLLNMNTNSMRSHEIKNAIIKDVNEFSGKQQQHDDMTLIVVKLN